MIRVARSVVLLLVLCNGAVAAESIALSKAFTTSPQPDTQTFETAFPNEDERRKLLQQISAFSSGASNVFLVDAATALDAFKASLSVLRGSHSAETSAVVNTSQPVRGEQWLVAYLGVGPSDPCAWIVEAVEIDGKTIKVSYRQPKATMVTSDIRKYYYWIPLGALDPGIYELNLFDTSQGVVTLSRRVSIRSVKGS